MIVSDLTSTLPFQKMWVIKMISKYFISNLWKVHLVLKIAHFYTFDCGFSVFGEFF